jgi:sugar O-acyltransferase (sialic acid O-acetyltransferase NeuD family)
MKTIAVFGASGHAKVVLDVLAKDGKYKIAGLIDRDGVDSSDILGHPLLGSDDVLPEIVRRFNISGALIAIGDNWVRHQVVKRVAEVVPELELVSSVHPSVELGPGVRIGRGTVVMPGVVINADAMIGECCIINTNASVDHDSIMEDFSSVAPGVVTGGRVRIGRFAAIGLGARIIDGKSVGEHSVVGAGATVLRDVPEMVVAYGTPATIIRSRAPGDRYL